MPRIAIPVADERVVLRDEQARVERDPKRKR